MIRTEDAENLTKLFKTLARVIRKIAKRHRNNLLKQMSEGEMIWTDAVVHANNLKEKIQTIIRQELNKERLYMDKTSSYRLYQDIFNEIIPSISNELIKIQGEVYDLIDIGGSASNKEQALDYFSLSTELLRKVINEYLDSQLIAFKDSIYKK